MGRLEKAVFLIIVIILIFLLAAFIIQAVVQDDSATIYRVSVVVDSSNDDYMRAFRLGLDDAALHYNVDYNPIPAGAEQISYLQRELESGTDAIIVFPNNAEAVSRWLDETNVTIPIISIGEKMQSPHVTLHVGADEYEMGAALARYVSETVPHKPVLLFADTTKLPDDAPRLAGFINTLSDLSPDTVIENPSPYHLIPNYLPSYGREYTFICLDERATEFVCSFYANDEEDNRAYDIFGIGHDSKTLDHLENGVATALIVQSNYDLGYISLENAVLAIQGKNPKSVQLETFIATPENIYKELQKILFPVS